MGLGFFASGSCCGDCNPTLENVFFFCWFCRSQVLRLLRSDEGAAPGPVPASEPPATSLQAPYAQNLGFRYRDLQGSIVIQTYKIGVLP